jgi:hypothetical protein
VHARGEAEEGGETIQKQASEGGQKAAEYSAPRRDPVRAGDEVKTPNSVDSVELSDAYLRWAEARENVGFAEADAERAKALTEAVALLGRFETVPEACAYACRAEANLAHPDGMLFRAWLAEHVATAWTKAWEPSVDKRAPTGAFTVEKLAGKLVEAWRLWSDELADADGGHERRAVELLESCANARVVAEVVLECVNELSGNERADFAEWVAGLPI